jgi:hypothetical protein
MHCSFEGVVPGDYMQAGDPNILEPEQDASIGEDSLLAMRVCPHCRQEHPAGTLICPQTGEAMMVEFALPQVEPVNIDYSPLPQKDRRVALGLEILPGLFGFLGIGWIYSGRTWIGLAWLAGYLIWQGVIIAFVIWSGSPAYACMGLSNLLWVGVSAYSLNSNLSSEPLIFGE